MTALDFVTRVVAALHKQQIPFMVVGSFSSNVYGKARSTRDADFVLELGDHSIAKLISEIGPDFRLDPQMSFETVTNTSRYKVSHFASAFTIEFFLLSDDPHDRERFKRRVVRDIGDGQQTFIPTPEDVIITKLRWSKQGKRTKDLDDAAGVVALQSERLDRPYMQRWCDVHGTRVLLDRLLH